MCQKVYELMQNIVSLIININLNMPKKRGQLKHCKKAALQAALVRSMEANKKKLRESVQKIFTRANTVHKTTGDAEEREREECLALLCQTCDPVHSKDAYFALADEVSRHGGVIEGQSLFEFFSEIAETQDISLEELMTKLECKQTIEDAQEFAEYNDPEEEDELSEEQIEEVLRKLAPKSTVRGVGYNGARLGFSKSSVNRAIAVQNGLKAAGAAKGQMSLEQCWEPVDEDLEDDELAEAIAAAGDEGKEAAPATVKYATCDEALAAMEMSPSLNPTRNAKTDKLVSDLAWQTIQAQSVYLFLQLWAGGVPGESAMLKMEASVKVAQLILNDKQTSKWGSKARTVRLWAAHYMRTGEHRKYRQGQHCKNKSYTIITQEDSKAVLRTQLRAMDDTERTPENFMKLLNDDVLQTIAGAPTSIGVSTAARWMRYLGFNPTTATKGWFTDGHERSDVVLDRADFIALMVDIQRKSWTYEGDDRQTRVDPNLAPGERPTVFIVHDEATFYCNEGRRIYWLENGKKKILPKSRGQSIMISGFICACHGFMSLNGRKGFEFFEAGKAREGWYTNADLVDLVKEVEQLFKDLHPHCDIVVGFDNSMTHRAKAANGLDAHERPLKDDSRAKNITVMRDGWYTNAAGERIVQPMQFGEDLKRPKGMKRILTERGLFKNTKYKGHRNFPKSLVPADVVVEFTAKREKLLKRKFVSCS